jgi:hypothetical protein
MIGSGCDGSVLFVLFIVLRPSDFILGFARILLLLEMCPPSSPPSRDSSLHSCAGLDLGQAWLSLD